MNLSEFNCPTCKQVLNESFTASEEAAMPSPGDLNLCGSCGTISEFTESGLRPMTEQELRSLDVEDKDNLILARRRIQNAKEKGQNARPTESPNPAG